MIRVVPITQTVHDEAFAVKSYPQDHGMSGVASVEASSRDGEDIRAPHYGPAIQFATERPTIDDRVSLRPVLCGQDSKDDHGHSDPERVRTPVHKAKA